MKVTIPKSDTVRWTGVLMVAAAGLSAGIGLAAWGTSAQRQPVRTLSQRASPERALATALPETADGPEGAEPETGAVEPEAPRSDVVEAGAPESETAEPETAEPETAESGPEPRTEPRAADLPPSEPVPATPGSLRLQRGRVAYLRCDLASGRDCVRDEPLEAAVWTALEGLMQCGRAPRAPGQADIRLDYRDGAPEVQWRDTFGDDVVRLDREVVLGCLRGPLSETRRSIDAQRLLVSFRFAVR